MKITYIGHSCFMLETGGIRIVTDPYAPDMRNKLKEIDGLRNPEIILISHGHGDHIGNLNDVYGNYTRVVANFEISSILARDGYKTASVNNGGNIKIGKIDIFAVKAEHSSSINGTYGGLAMGYVIKAEGKSIYFFGDTDIFGDMALIEERFHPEIGLVPIGGTFTMDAETASFACNKFFRFSIIIPMHYNTFPAINIDPDSFVKRISNAKTIILAHGENIGI